MHYFSFAPVQINSREHSQQRAGTQQQLEHSDVASEYSGLESDDEEEAPTSKRPRIDNRIESD